MVVAVLSVVLAVLQWGNVVAPIPPLEGNCTNSFVDIHPPTIMKQWFVVSHADNFQPPTPECLIIKFARRAAFDSDFRMDIFYVKNDEQTFQKIETTILPGDMISSAGNPIQVSISGVPTSLMPNLMVAHIDESNGCMAAWACQDMQSSAQKSAWIMCDKPNVAQSVINEIQKKICSESQIDESHFRTINPKSC